MAPDEPTRVRMRNVDFYVAPDVVLHIRRLEGRMLSKRGGPILFDDKRSFVLHLDDAEVALTARDISTLLNKFVFAYKGAPLSKLEVKTAGADLVQKGVLRKGVNLTFEIRARVDVTEDGRIRLRPKKTKILGVNARTLMRAFGLSLEKLVDLRGARGASVKGNDLFLDPNSLLPPPTIEGRLTAVRVEGDRLVQVFGSPNGGAARRAALEPPDRNAPNYMFYKGGTLRFGKLIMVDAEMQIVDLDRADPFKFDLDRYHAQLVAGYSRSLPDLGLEVFMRDVDKLERGRAPAPVASAGPAAGGLARATPRGR